MGQFFKRLGFFMLAAAVVGVVRFGAAALVRPGYDPPTIDDSGGLQLKSWKKEIALDGKPQAYWDYYGCIEKNFTAMTDQAAAMAGIDTALKIMNPSGALASRAVLVNGLRYPTYLGKSACSRAWDWEKVGAEAGRLDGYQIREKFMGQAALKMSTTLDDQMMSTGWDDMLHLKHLSENMALLKWISLCRGTPSRKGCENIGATKLDRQTLAGLQTLASQYPFNADNFTIANAPPTRLRLGYSPDVFLYTDFADIISDNDFLNGLLLNNATPVGGRAMLLKVTNELDGEWLPVTANPSVDGVRAMLAVALASDLGARAKMAAAEPKAFDPLIPASMLFVSEQTAPSCGGAVRDRQGFYCPAEGTLYVKVLDPTTHRLGREIGAGPALAVAAHELAHYALWRKDWVDSPFLNEGLASAIGERSLRGVLAAQAYMAAQRVSPAQRSKQAKAELLERVAMEKLAAIWTARAPLTTTQQGLLCAVEKAGVTPEDLERGLKASPGDFQAEGLVGYAQAWIVFEGLLGASGNDFASSADLRSLTSLRAKLDSSITAGDLAVGRAELRRLAASANSRMKALRTQFPSICHGTVS